MIRAHIATYPPREAMLRQSIMTIAPQVDLVSVCLNEYDKVPAFLSEIKNVEAFIPNVDHKDVGKFATTPRSDDLVFFVDDDLLYHENFVRRMIRIGRNVGLDNNVFGVHGANYGTGVRASKLDRKVYHFKRPLKETTRVEQLGTGTMMALGKNVAPLDFMLGSEKFVDVRYARWLFQNGIASWAISRPRGFVREIVPENDDHETIWQSFTKSTPEHVMDEIRAFAEKYKCVDSAMQN